jgi:uncharacterized protein
MTITQPRMSVPEISSAMPPAFHVMTKPRGALCNLGCRYCFYSSREGLYPGSDFRMSKKLLESYIRQHIEAHRAPEIIFTWQGGEPALMGLDFFRRVVSLQQKYSRPGTRIMNAFQTNGTFLTEEWCKFFRENQFLLGISLDGPCELHDAWRVDKKGGPTFDRVMGGVTLLREHQVEFNVLACVHAANAAHGPEIYRFLRDEAGASFIQFIPIVEHDDKEGCVTSWSITGRQYGEFLISVFDEWVRSDVGRTFVQIFDVALGVWFGQPSALCVFAETCGNGVALEHNGDLYSCDHFVDPEHKLGNIGRTHLAELIALARQRKFGLDKRVSLPPACRECTVLFVCNGGCPKDRFSESEAEPGLNVLCEGYYAFFTYIDPAMKIMAGLLRNRRPPSEIMAMEGRSVEKSWGTPATGGGA